MRVSSAILCDHATVRDGLLHLLGGGITRLWREQLPSPIGVTLALILEVRPDEGDLHEVQVVLANADGGVVAEVRGALQPEFGRLEPTETQLLPMVIPLGTAGVAMYGKHTFTIRIDGESQDHPLAFWVLHPEEQVLPPL